MIAQKKYSSSNNNSEIIKWLVGLYQINNLEIVINVVCTKIQKIYSVIEDYIWNALRINAYVHMQGVTIWMSASA